MPSTSARVVSPNVRASFPFVVFISYVYLFAVQGQGCALATVEVSRGRPQSRDVGDRFIQETDIHVGGWCFAINVSILSRFVFSEKSRYIVVKIVRSVWLSEK